MRLLHKLLNNKWYYGKLTNRKWHHITNCILKEENDHHPHIYSCGCAIYKDITLFWQWHYIAYCITFFDIVFFISLNLITTLLKVSC